ncbi:chloride channel protein [Frigidibacter sp. ROC022]|uniref:chloride channel protein n=1 Tax=Frigidibacter sp. ROC022 TaxID=2971796 RepID=UPI00215B1C5E|nr:chloride channel protein [Frigidibacter sp. ROC022]MCR8723684.1 chloride channel protein [Frigidibacter sp. ROC022]
MAASGTKVWVRSVRRQARRALVLARAARDNAPAQARFWLAALLVGTASGLAATGFRFSIDALQSLVYGASDHEMHSLAPLLPWYWLIAVPTLGGLLVGVILHRYTPDGRVRAVADVIEGAALQDGRVERREGIASALASLITLGTGGSSGREGPVVHLAGLISSAVADWMKASGVTGRELLGCAVAAAVSASFNAPIAGTIFALEVVLRHYAIHAFGPIALASVVGAVISRSVLGDVTEFSLVLKGAGAFYAELPAYLILGLVSGAVAVVLIWSIFRAEDWADRWQERLGLHRALRPMVAGLGVGLLAIWFPHVIGVGYETTSRALTGQLVLGQAIAFAVVKVIAVSLTLGGRMGGGIFSPAVMLGALTGLAFGQIATAVFPGVSGSETLYALAGLGAVSAAVLGAPISTTLIVFELTGNWQAGLAVMTAVAISTALASRLAVRSYFLTQLLRRNIRLAAGPQAYLLSTFSVSKLMRKKGDKRAAREEACWELIEDGIHINGNATLDEAMPMFERTGVSFLPVVTLGGEGDPPELWGALFHVDALKAFNAALAAQAAEEHS